YNGFSKYFSFGGEGIISENDPDEQEALSPYLTRHIKRFGDYVIDLKNIPNAIDMAVSIPMKQDIAT
ncbi:MAG TPA: hypothetical protein VIM42_10265, partial [Clostridium sp.]